MVRFFFRDMIYILKSRHIKENPRRKPLMKFIVVFGIIMLLFSWTFSVFENKIKPTVMAMAEARARVIAINTINESINEEIVSKIRYEDLITIRKDADNKVAALQTNIVKMNEMQAILSQVVQEKFAQIDSSDLQIPLGNLLNSTILAGWGPRITIRIMPIGTVQSKFVDNFISAGINQTKHKISLDVKARIFVVVPLISINTEATTNVPIAETIIVGNVPDTYIDISGSSNEEIKSKALDIGTNFSTNAADKK